ncbi:MAG: hypothetical protein AAFR87_35595, partial [Bacteroidota bacterium]
TAPQVRVSLSSLRIMLSSYSLLQKVAHAIPELVSPFATLNFRGGSLALPLLRADPPHLVGFGYSDL